MYTKKKCLKKVCRQPKTGILFRMCCMCVTRRGTTVKKCKREGQESRKGRGEMTGQDSGRRRRVIK